jgi:hypothetical protein
MTDSQLITDDRVATMRAGMGRIYRPDSRDQEHMLDAHRLRGIALVKPVLRALPWKVGPILDQGQTNRCTVFSFAQHLQTEPYACVLNWPDATFDDWYAAAQAVDGIPGAHSGSTERAVQEVATTRGIVREYLWVTDEAVAQEYLRTRGTLIFGSDWFESMFTPDANGYVEATGTPDPSMGHEYLVRWYYNKQHAKYPDTYEFINSWGDSFGQGGHFFMKGDTFRYLWLHLNGDLVSPVEVARVPVTPAKPTKKPVVKKK